MNQEIQQQEKELLRKPNLKQKQDILVKLKQKIILEFKDKFNKMQEKFEK